ncbi:MAG: hypothetical protein K8S13_18045 [Desulfobacula sp.]|uniref:hypothetical protein n=1 Tax=Desulfobacula sp. TaxID=2593537 RepID=UPI0025BF648F|nr:hypothetical protein [Desulfobacula sp.]MCD4721740.1 hypothetical protein [Desulfobacula sp.]
MKSAKFFLVALFGVFFLVSACQDEKGKGDYSGVSDLIAERNKARYTVAENPPKKSVSSRKKTTNKTNTSKPISTPKKEELSTIILYEELVEIVGSESGRTLAKAVASINKKGQIVKIKILKE